MANVEAIEGLYTGLATLWDSNGSLSPIACFRKHLPPSRRNVASDSYFPYVILKLRIDSQMEFESCARQFWRHYLNFEVYHRDGESLATTVGTIARIFNDPTLKSSFTMPTGHRFMGCRQTHGNEAGGAPKQETGIVESRTLSFEFQTSVAL